MLLYQLFQAAASIRVKQIIKESGERVEHIMIWLGTARTDSFLEEVDVEQDEGLSVTSICGIDDKKRTFVNKTLPRAGPPSFSSKSVGKDWKSVIR